MSEWDESEPHEKRYQLAQDAGSAARVVAADRQMIAALLSNPTDLKALRAALKADANPDRSVINGHPALHVAIHRRDLKALEILLRYAPRTDDIAPDGAVALDVAHRLRWAEGVRLLQLHGAEPRLAKGEPPDLDDIYEPSYQKRINGLLYQMVRKGTPEQVQQMIDLGADVNARDPHSNPSFPPLHHAACICDEAKVEILLKAGADVLMKSTRGHEITDTMWQSRPEHLYSDAWLRIHDRLRQAGYTNLFDVHPLKLDAAQLREKVFIGGREDPTLLQYLVNNGKADTVIDLLTKPGAPALTAAELLKKDTTGFGGTLLDSFGRAGKLSRIFTAAVWQGRVEEMMSLRPAVENNFTNKKQVEFDAAYQEVLGQRLKDLRARAPKLKL
ncbi:MAG TPA: hypothetical protein VEF76_00455 [Patescibacteria group bacterium]|nr:hypothetical protein [Patescibacteria group bacterium]